MKFILTALFFLLLTEQVFCTSITVSGNVNGTWNADTVLVESNLMIKPGETLIIAPGTFIQFQSYFRIDVEGQILAQGTSVDTIVFTIRDTSNFYFQLQGRGGWSGIRFRDIAAQEDSSILSFCRFEFSKATEDSINSFGGAIFSYKYDKLRISNCLLFHNYSFFSGGAVYLNESDARIENCKFVSNYSGNTGTIYGYGGGVCSMKSSPIVRRNEFYSNSSTGVGGAASFDSSDPVFENNIMQFNFSALGGALGVLRSSPASTFSNNLVTNNTALFFGGGVCCIRSFPLFSNFTIANNSAAYAGGFYCNDSASPSTYNTVIWGNSGLGKSVYIWDVFSAPNFYYCDIEGDTTGFEGSGAHQGYHGQYLNNMNENPQFFDSGIYPFQLFEGSPCINAGTPDAGFLNLPNLDLAEALRISENRIDLGAYEYTGYTAIQLHSKASESLIVYPNPIAQTTTISLPGGLHAGSELLIYDSQGKTIRRICIHQNESSVTWNGMDEKGNSIPHGLYIFSLKNAGKLFTCKAIK